MALWGGLERSYAEVVVDVWIGLRAFPASLVDEFVGAGNDIQGDQE